MNTYYEIRVKRTFVNELNAYTTFKEVYLVEAVSYTEAEARITKHVTETLQSEINILRISKSKIEGYIGNIGEVQAGVEESFYKVKITYMTVTDSGRDKKANEYYVTKAVNCEEASDVLLKEYGEQLTDMEVTKVEKTKIKEVI